MPTSRRRHPPPPLPLPALALLLAMLRVAASQTCAFNAAAAGDYTVASACSLDAQRALSGTLTLAGGSPQLSPAASPPALGAHPVVTASGSGDDNGRHFKLSQSAHKIVASHLQFSGGIVDRTTVYPHDAAAGENRGGVISVNAGQAEFTSCVFNGCGGGMCARFGGVAAFLGPSSGVFTRYVPCFFFAGSTL